jgi:hypothetical protein
METYEEGDLIVIPRSSVEVHQYTAIQKAVLIVTAMRTSNPDISHVALFKYYHMLVTRHGVWIDY